MAETKSIGERLWNRIFAIPVVAQYWAKRTARSESAQFKSDEIPFAPLKKPLSQCRVALITTGGTHLKTDKPFDMENPQGDASYREIPGDTAPEDITITHKYYNHQDADKDLNVVLPFDRMRELISEGVIGELAPIHFGFMGHIDGEQLPILLNQTAPEVAEKLKAADVDFAFMTPA